MQVRKNTGRVNAYCTLSSWGPESERISPARFPSRMRNTSIVECYSQRRLPSKGQLDAVEETLPKDSIAIVVGDLQLSLQNLSFQLTGNEHLIKSTSGEFLCEKREVLTSAMSDSHLVRVLIAFISSCTVEEPRTWNANLSRPDCHSPVGKLSC